MAKNNTNNLAANMRKRKEALALKEACRRMALAEVQAARLKKPRG